MKAPTHITNIIEATDTKSRYDAEAKKILADKTILAWIMQYTMSEFKDYPISVIRNCIEGTPEIATTRVRPGHTPEAIHGLPTEDKVPGEGEIRFDIRFYATTPTKKSIKIIVNVEAQSKYNQGYNIVTRGIFYGARLLSAQLDTEFVPPKYNNIKKVYSIWVCMNVPSYAAYTITRYSIQKQDLYGVLKKEPRYDLMEIITVCLGSEEQQHSGNRLHHMLGILFSQTLPPREKELILERDFCIETSAELEGGLRQMCNLSDLVEEKGIEKGKETGLAALVKTLKEFLPDFDTLYSRVIQNEGYESVTEEEVKKYYS